MQLLASCFGKQMWMAIPQRGSQEHRSYMAGGYTSRWHRLKKLPAQIQNTNAASSGAASRPLMRLPANCFGKLIQSGKSRTLRKKIGWERNFGDLLEPASGIRQP